LVAVALVKGYFSVRLAIVAVGEQALPEGAGSEWVLSRAEVESRAASSLVSFWGTVVLPVLHSQTLDLPELLRCRLSPSMMEL
jgi:hypothetical protein